MEERYRFEALESKWQEKWQKEEAYKVTEDPGKPKYYCLEMFPYPSGNLHMGHVRNYSIGDVVARFKTMRGFNAVSYTHLLEARGILGGLSLSGGILWCVTELCAKAELEEALSVIEEVLKG